MHERHRLSTVLRVSREAAGITGAEAAKRAGMSQPKISKIENAVLRLYGAGESSRRNCSNVRAHRTRHTRVRARSCGAARRASNGRSPRSRRRRGSSAAFSSRWCPFQLAVVPGLLQTAEYMRRIFTGFTEDEAARTIAARQDRATGAVRRVEAIHS